MSTTDFLKRRALRTLVPYIAWSLISIAWGYVIHGVITDLSPSALADGLLNSRYASVYWFFPPLFAAYLCMPLLVKAKGDRRLLSYLIGCGVLLASALPLACTLLGIGWNTTLCPPVVGGFTLYVVIGWALSTQQLRRGQLHVLYAMGIIGCLVQLLGTFALSSVEAGVDSTFKGYLNLPALLQSVAIFAFARNVSFKEHPLNLLASACSRIAPLTLGVYLEHHLVIDAITSLGVVDSHSIWWRTAGALLVFCLCLILTWLIRRVPVLRRIVG